MQLKNIISGKVSEKTKKHETKENEINQEISENEFALLRRRKSLRKTGSTDDYTGKNIGITDPELLDKLDSLSKTVTREVIL